MASLNPEKLQQDIKLSSGDGKEPNFDFIHPEWPRLPVLSKGAQELFGDGSRLSRSSPENGQVVVSRVDYTSFLPCRE